MIKLSQPQFWYNKSVLAYLMLPFACLYALALYVRKLIYKIKYKKNKKLISICVGNVTVGGGGKTPISIMIAKSLRKSGHKICFLSKGYGRKTTGIFYVSDKHTVREVGDEPLLLAKYFPTLVCNNRNQALNILAKDGFTHVIMDDGLQDISIYPDINILVIDGKYGLGNGFLLPAGPLRESFSNVKKRLDAILIIGKDECDIASNIDQSIPILYVDIKFSTKDLDKKAKYVAFAGLAINEKFFTTLNSLSLSVVKQYEYPDHYCYTEKDLVNMYDKARSKNALLVTTEKDYVRLNNYWRQKVLVLPMELKCKEIMSILG